jgi:hypothetical protein
VVKFNTKFLGGKLFNEKGKTTNRKIQQQSAIKTLNFLGGKLFNEKAKNHET